jgi:hypothetical protein
MTIKTMLVDTGRHETFVTTTYSGKNLVTTKSFPSTSLKNVVDQVVEMYFAREAQKLVVDDNGIGVGLIDELVAKFKKYGYKYNYKEGTVQHSSNNSSNRGLVVTGSDGSKLILSNGSMEVVKGKLK